MNKIKLDPRSALFLEWGSKFYQNENLREYLNHLDLSAANEIKNEYDSISGTFEEAFINRAFLIENYIENKLLNSSEEHLIIVLAAGKTPLPLDLVQKYSEKINKVIEIDISGMDEKRELYYVHYPQYSEKIKCITADFRATPILEFMNNLLHEYYNDLPCIILLEGVSYFLNKEELEKIVGSFKSKNKNNTFILEYMLPSDELSADRQEIPYKFFGKDEVNIIKDKKQLVSGEILSDMMKKFDGKLVHKDNLSNAEKLRTGGNKYFSEPGDNWLECSVWEI